MITFQINRPDEAIRQALEDRINSLAKPKGSLGRLESLALQIGMIQQTLHPVLSHPVNVIYAADHGIADEGVSQSPKEVTRQVIYNFLNGGSGVCYLARQHGFDMKIVDGGVDYDFPENPRIISRKIRKGTRNFLHEAAMTQEEMEKALEVGAEIVTLCHEEGCNVISFGEMGIGNTSASSMWMSCLTGIPLIECVGAGSGLNAEGVRHKYNVLKAAQDNYKGDGSTLDIMRYFGGIELGTSGLIVAYRTAAAEAIAAAEVEERTVNEEVTVAFEYPYLNGIMRIVKEENPVIVSQQFEMDCKMTLRIRKGAMERLKARLQKVESAYLVE